MSILDELQKYYKDVYFHEESNYSKIYRAFNQQINKYVYLKIIEKKQLKSGDYNFLLKQIEREEIITKLCRSDFIVNLYQKYQMSDYIIFEYEYLEWDLKNYIFEKGPLKENKYFFKNIVLSLAKALYIINKNGIIHRDIKPHNIFMNQNKNIIKLGDFGCSIFIKENTSDPIGTIFYTAPEIIKNLKYDEKCDLWSLGITLYEIYFGELPYGSEYSPFSIKKAIYDEKNFKFKKTNIPTLDILFKRLLTINPKNRMDYNEFFQYVCSSNDFMKDNVICVNNNLKYKYIYDIILKEKEEEKKLEDYNKKMLEENDDEDEEYKNPDYDEEALVLEVSDKKNIEKILNFVEGDHLPNIMDFPNGSIKPEQEYNNIIYYDENVQMMGSIKQDCDYFERHTPGAFILCTSLNSLELVKREILKANKNDQRIVFNLITTGGTFEKVMAFLEENQDFKRCIMNACIYCLNLQKYKPLKYKYNMLHDDIYNRQFEVVNFINMFSAKEIKPFPSTKLVTYEDYIQKYKDRHFKISQFYGNLTKETYEEYYKKMKDLIEKESNSNELKLNNQKVLFNAFLKFNIIEDLKELDKLIIKEYTKNTFYGDLNKWLMNSKFNFYEPVAYFTARLMFSLNSYANENKTFCEEEKELYRGVKMPYTCLLPYKRAKKRIICLSSFTSTSEDETFAKNFSGRGEAEELYKNSLKFSVVFTIKNLYKNNWVSSGINIQNVAKYKHEKEYLFQPFTFYYVKEVNIDINNYIADIYLEAVGKYEILEEKIKYGKEIIYNKNENIVQIKY